MVTTRKNKNKKKPKCNNLSKAKERERNNELTQLDKKLFVKSYD